MNWIQSLETVDQGQHYIHVVQLSQRLQFKICQLRQKLQEQADDDYSEQKSPTETIIAYYDDDIDRDQDKPAYTNIMHKPLPSIVSSIYHLHSFDSAVDLDMNEKAYVYNNQQKYKPLPSIQYNRARAMPIIHTKKKYFGLRGLLKRKYRLNNIVVTRSKLSYLFVKLLASYDKHTGDKKAVLKLSMTLCLTNVYKIPHFDFTFYHQLESMTKTQKILDQALIHLSDSQIQSALPIWLNYYHYQLPSIRHLSLILRHNLNIFLVYNL